MPFRIHASTITGAIGAGAGDKTIHFNDLTHRLTFKGNGETAEAYATFGDGPELKAAREWANNAHGLSSVEVEPFDAQTEADRRQAEADQEAADKEAANTEAKRILADAKESAARLLKDSQIQAEALLMSAKKDAAETVAANEGMLARAQKDASGIVDAANKALAAAEKMRTEMADAVKKAAAKQQG